MTHEVETFDDLEHLSRSTAERIARRAREKPTLSIALSGGSTPRRLFEMFAGPWRERIPWDGVHLFWADERFVPASHPDNNYRLARALFIEAVPIPDTNVHPVRTDLQDASRAADAYDRELRSFFGDEAETLVDVALLGLGADGHTASLFPGSTVPAERWAAAVHGPARRPPRHRVTLTFDALNRSQTVVFLVAGADKQDALSRVLGGDPALPASHVRGLTETVFLVDKTAKSGI